MSQGCASPLEKERNHCSPLPLHAPGKMLAWTSELWESQMQAGPFLGERGRGGDLWARVGMFGYSRALRPVMGEHHGGAPPSLPAVPRAPRRLLAQLSFAFPVGLMHAVGAGQAAA